MECLVASVDHIKFDIEVALDEQFGALPLPFSGMDKSIAAVCQFYTSMIGCQKGPQCPFRTDMLGEYYVLTISLDFAQMDQTVNICIQDLNYLHHLIKFKRRKRLLPSSSAIFVMSMVTRRYIVIK
ncbi:hypothetical protein MTP99_018537 [Tenebrio molitor]|nr:hypothetical protein MTP99_018537 [Tenebrio molitor]